MLIKLSINKCHRILKVTWHVGYLNHYILSNKVIYVINDKYYVEA